MPCSNCRIISVCMSFHGPESCILVFESPFYDIFCKPTYFGLWIYCNCFYSILLLMPPRKYTVPYWMILGSNPGLLQRLHWLSDALTTVINNWPKQGLEKVLRRCRAPLAYSTCRIGPSHTQFFSYPLFCSSSNRQTPLFRNGKISRCYNIMWLYLQTLG